jgi:hypothetical protein
MTIRGVNGGELSIDWGDSSNGDYIFTGSNQVITHEYTAGTYQQKWAVNKLEVTRIISNSQRLSGALPLELQGFNFLTNLSISANSFNSDLSINGWPSAFASMSGMVTFTISLNDFTGDLSTWSVFSTWSSLINFFIQDNSFTGDISNWSVFSTWGSIQQFWIFKNGLTGDISTWSTFSVWEDIIIFYINTNNFVADLSDWYFPLWVNLTGFRIYNNESYGYVSDFGQGSWNSIVAVLMYGNVFTGLNDHVDIYFSSRVVYTATLKSILFNNNSEYLTGTYQQPDIGTYGGDINDLTETEIDNLAAGTDYDGLGTNVVWATLEKVWILENLDTTSTSGVLRYAFNFIYDSSIATIKVVNSGALGLPATGDFVPNTAGLSDNWNDLTPGSYTYSIVTGNGFVNNAQKAVKLTQGLTNQFFFSDIFAVTNGNTYLLSLRYRGALTPSNNIKVVNTSFSNLVVLADTESNSGDAKVLQSATFVADDTGLAVVLELEDTANEISIDEVELIEV